MKSNRSRQTLFQRIIAFVMGKSKKERSNAPEVKAKKKAKPVTIWGRGLARKINRRRYFGGASERMLKLTSEKRHEMRVAKTVSKN